MLFRICLILSASPSGVLSYAMKRSKNNCRPHAYISAKFNVISVTFVIFIKRLLRLNCKGRKNWLELPELGSNTAVMMLPLMLCKKTICSKLIRQSFHSVNRVPLSKVPHLLFGADAGRIAGKNLNLVWVSSLCTLTQEASHNWFSGQTLKSNQICSPGQSEQPQRIQYSSSALSLFSLTWLWWLYWTEFALYIFKLPQKLAVVDVHKIQNMYKIRSLFFVHCVNFFLCDIWAAGWLWFKVSVLSKHKVFQIKCEILEKYI